MSIDGKQATHHNHLWTRWQARPLLATNRLCDSCEADFTDPGGSGVGESRTEKGPGKKGSPGEPPRIEAIMTFMRAIIECPLSGRDGWLHLCTPLERV